MAKPSIFREFMAGLKKDWRTTFPSVQPLKQTFDTLLPKASTFAAGIAPALGGMHVFLNFQHSDKFRTVGSFTINIVLMRQVEPSKCGFVGLKIDLDDPEEGSYRIGPLLGKRDKWWHLKKIDRSPLLGVIAWTPMGDVWEATTYDDELKVICEAIVDVNSDVRSVLIELGLLPGQAVSSG